MAHREFLLAGGAGLLTPSLHSSYQAVLTLVSGAPLTPCIKKDIFFFLIENPLPMS